MLRPLLFVLLVACGGSSASNAPKPPTATPTPSPAPTPTPTKCPAGQRVFAHGCGGPAFETGCYASCTDRECAAGFTCTEVTIDPCRGQMCDACGTGAKLCLATEPSR